jgi:hypothetical protein
MGSDIESGHPGPLRECHMPIVYVYSIRATAKELEEKAIQLGEPIFWAADLSNFQMGKGIPQYWSDQGSIFSRMGELRWTRAGEKYQALIFADRALVGMDECIEGNWESEEEEIFLQDLSEPKVRPSFEKYPHGDVVGLLKVKACKLNGVVVSISPREILPRRLPNDS